MSDFTPAHIPDGRVHVGDKTYLPDAKGALVPVELVKPQHLLEDETVRKIAGFWLALSEQVSRFREHTFMDLGDFDAILAQEYGATRGGAKGNKTYQTHDGLFRIEVRINDQLDFGPELQVGKELFDECLNEWSADTRAELRMLVTQAFSTDQKGTINRTALFQLLRVTSDDERWTRAADAVRDALRVVGSKTYIRMSVRPDQQAGWSGVTIDLAKA
jgi:hypothetical protein